jgi:hypothetical protein
MRKFHGCLLLIILLSAGLIGVALQAEALEGWKITMKNIGGDDGNFGNFTICLLDDGTFFLTGSCETGRWFAAGPRRWAQGGCANFDLAFVLDGQVASGKLKGKVHEFEVDATPVVGAWFQKATRNDAACSGSLQSGTESITGQ